MIDVVRHLQQSIVLAVQEYSPVVWKAKPTASVVVRLTKVELDQSK